MGRIKKGVSREVDKVESNKKNVSLKQQAYLVCLVECVKVKIGLWVRGVRRKNFFELVVCEVSRLDPAESSNRNDAVITPWNSLLESVARELPLGSLISST